MNTIWNSFYPSNFLSLNLPLHFSGKYEESILLVNFVTAKSARVMGGFRLQNPG